MFWLCLCIACWFIGPSESLADAEPEWTGYWESRWRGGGAQLILEQQGDRVTGVYPVLDGVIEGQVRGRTLEGTWSDPGGSGRFVFSMAPDGQSFMGRFGTGEWWTARRQLPQELAALVPDKSSPAKALASFLIAANEASDGRIDRIGPALEVLDFRAYPERLAPAMRMQLAIRFFRVLDRLSFRVWSVQPFSAEFSDEFTAELFQAGTEESFTIQFRRSYGHDGAEAWLIIVPPEDSLRDALSRLLQAHGGEAPHARQHHELQSPRDTMRTFVEQWSSWHLEPTELFLRTMDLSRIPPAMRAEEGARRGHYLKEIIDRIGLVIWQEIPDNPRQRSPYLHFLHPKGSVEIVPVQQPDGSWIWQFSADTMANVRPLFMALEDMPLDPRLNRADSETTPFFLIRNRVRSIHRGLLQDIGGVELWQFLLLALWLIVSLPASWLLASALAWTLRLRRDQAPTGGFSVQASFIWPLRLILITWIGLLGLRWIGLPQQVDVPLRMAISTVLVLSAGWFLYHLIGKISALFAAHAERYHFRDEILRSLLTSIARLAVIIGAIVYLAHILSVPIQGVIAGLGIGGLAVALAARGTIENFIGGLTLLADGPIQVGDTVCFGDKRGVVESIGLRSIKVRSADRSILTIPNAEFANLHIENLSRRDRIRLFAEIGLRYETTPDQLRWILAEIRKLLIEHPMIHDEPARARLAGFGEHSINIEMLAYVATFETSAFLAVREDIFLRLIDIIEQSGSGFAFPSTVNYLARDAGIDDARRQSAEAAIQALREGHQLPFPEFDDATRQQFRNRLDYPPAGSVQGPGG